MGFPSIKLEKKHVVSVHARIINTVIFVILGFLFSGIFIIIQGFNPITVYAKMISYSFFNVKGLKSSIMAGVPLMLCGLSVSVAFRLNLKNIGVEGQYAIGAICGTAFALLNPNLPAPILIVIMFVLCALGGALWAMVAGALKAFWNVNETIITLMMNYIALLLLDYLCYGPWMARGQTTPVSDKIPQGMHLPYLGQTGVSSGILIAVAIAILLTLFFKYTTAGYQTDVIRHSVRSAQYAGMDVKKSILIVLGLSGAIAGLAGYVQVAGIVHRIQSQLPGGNGYTGIVIAYLSRMNPLVVIIVSILLGGINNGSSSVQIMGVPSQIAVMIQGSIMVFVIAGEFLNQYKVRIRRKARKAEGSQVSGRNVP